MTGAVGVDKTVEGKALALDIDPDMEWARLVCVPADNPSAFLGYDAAREELNVERITYGLDLDLVKETCSKLEELELGDKVRIAQADPPVHGVDGYIDFAVDVSGQATYKAADEDSSNIDFREATSVVCVNEGALLATLHPPKQGKPGKSIRGETLPPRSPKEPMIRPGQSVHFEPKTRQFTALRAGRPTFVDHILSVLPVYEVAGDVCFDTGHVRFNGSVIVQGNVLDDFNIEAKDIVVMGTVGACLLNAEGNITVRGGINGRDRAVIRAGGEVVAKYINNARVETLHDLTVNREIVNSTVLCNGRVRVNTLIGGETVAKLGVEANVLGSDIGVATRVDPGVDIQIRKVDDALDVVDGQIGALLAPVQMVLGDKAKYRSLSDERKDAVRQAYEKFLRLKEAHEKLAARRQKLLENSTEMPVKEVVVFKTLNPDTIVRTDICMRNFAKQHSGPLCIRQDVDRSTMKLDPYSASAQTTSTA